MADINKCTERYLTGVVGLDQTIASRVIRYKRKVGTLKHIDELLRVKGITRHLFDLIASKLQVKDQKVTALGETLPYEVTGSTLLSSNNSQENYINKGRGMRNSFEAKKGYNLRGGGGHPFQTSAKKRTATAKGKPRKKKKTLGQTSKRRCGRNSRKTQPTKSTDIQEAKVKKENVFMLTPMSIELSSSGEMLTIMYKSPTKMFRGRKQGDFDEREHSKTSMSTVVIEKPSVALNENPSNIRFSKVPTGKTPFKRRRSGAFPSGKGKGSKKRRLNVNDKDQQPEAQNISNEPSLLNKVIPIESKHQSVEKWLSALPVEIECAKVNADGEAFLGGLKENMDKMPDHTKKRSDEEQPGPSGMGNDMNGNKSMDYGLKSQEVIVVVASPNVMGANGRLVPVANTELVESSKELLLESIGLKEKKESNQALDPQSNQKRSKNEIPVERKLSKLQDGGHPGTQVVEDFNGNNDPSAKLKDSDRIEGDKSERSVAKEKEQKVDERSGDKNREGREKNGERRHDRKDAIYHDKDLVQNGKERKDDRKDHGRERREDKRDDKEQKSGLKQDNKEKKDDKKSEKKIEDKKDDPGKQGEKKSSSKEKVEETKKSGGGWFCVLL